MAGRDITVGLRLTADGKGLINEVRASKGEVEKLGQSVDGSALSIRGMAAAVFLGNAALDAMKQAFSMVGTAARGLLDGAIAAERLATSLKFATGSAAEAAREQKFLRDTVYTLGLELSSASVSYTKLAAAARGSAMEGENAQRLFVSVSKAAATLGLSAADADGALLALSQMMSKGTVSAEELRGQLGERIPGAMGIAARAMGVSTAKLGEMLEQGLLLSDDFLPKFAAEMEKTFGEGADTTQAAVNRINSAMADFRMFAGGALAAVADEILGLKTAGKTLGQDNTIQEWARRAAKSVAMVYDVVREFGLLVPNVMRTVGGAFASAARDIQLVWEAGTAIITGKGLDGIKKAFRDRNAFVAEYNKDMSERWFPELAADRVDKWFANLAKQQAAGASKAGAMLDADLSREQQKTIDAIGSKAEKLAAEYANHKRNLYDALISGAIDIDRYNKERARLEQWFAETSASVKAGGAKLKKDIIDVFGDGSFITKDKSVARMIEEQQKAINDFNTEIYRDEVNAAKKATADWERAQESFVRDQQAAAKAAQQEAKSISDQAKSLREQTEEYGLSADALYALEQARLDVAIAAAEQFEIEQTLAGASNEEIAAIWDKIDALKGLKDARAGLFNRKAAIDSANGAVAEWARASDDIERSLTDALMRGFESGKGFAENFKDTLKNLFESLILRPIIQPIAQYGSQMVTGAMGMGGMGASGSAMASGGGSLLSSGGSLVNSIGSSLPSNMYGASMYSGLGALGGAMYGYEKAGVRGATIGGVLGYAGTAALGGAATGAAVGVATGTSIAGGAASGAMASATAALQAIPVWGWVALAALAIFGGGKKKPSDKAAWGNIDLSSLETSNVGSMTGKKYSEENNEARDAALEVVSGYTAGLKALGAEIGGDLRLVIGSRDGLRADFGGDGTNEINTTDSEEYFKLLLRELTARSTGLAENLKGVLIGFEGTTEELFELAAALDVLQDYAAADPMTAVAEAAEAAGRSAWDVWKQQGADMRSALAAWDGSAAAAAELATLTQSRYQVEMALAQQIHAALASTSAMFASTAEEMRYGTLDQAAKYDYLREKSIALEEAMATALDPAMIEGLAVQLNETAKSAWALLGEEERKIKIDEYEAYLAEIDALTTERLNAAGATISGEHDASLPDSITAAIEEAMDRVAAQFMAAATAMETAAATPVTVEGSATVTVDYPGGSLDAEVALG